MRVGEVTAEARARNVSIVGLVLQFSLAMCLLLLYLFDRSTAVFSTMRLAFGGVFIWSALAILYHQRRHVAVESLETDRLRKERATILGQYGDVEVEDLGPPRRELLEDEGGDLAARDPLELGVRGRESHPDLPLPDGAEHGVAGGVERRVAVRVPQEPLGEIELHTGQPEPA